MNPRLSCTADDTLVCERPSLPVSFLNRRSRPSVKSNFTGVGLITAFGTLSAGWLDGVTDWPLDATVAQRKKPTKSNGAFTSLCRRVGNTKFLK